MAYEKQARFTINTTSCKSWSLFASILDVLHDSILLSILEKLTRPSDRLVWSLSCKHFYLLEASARSRITLLTTHSLPYLAWRYPCLQHLDLSPCTFVTDDSLRCVAVVMRTRLLSLNLAKVRTFSYLGVNYIAKHCPSLLHLNLSQCVQLQDLGVMTIAYIQNLHSLNIKGCKDVTDLALVFLTAYCKRMRSLCLKWCTGITDETLISVGSNCLELQELDLSYTEITNIGISAISKLNRLQKLSLVACSRLNDQGLDHIRNGSKSLEALDVSRCRGISYTGVTCLVSGASSLRHIAISYCFPEKDDVVSQNFVQVKGLRSLQLDGCDVSTIDLGVLKTCCTTLKELSLSKCKGLTDTDVSAAVTGCVGLERLDLTCCQDITDVGLFSVASCCTNLVCIKMESCIMVTEYGIDKLCGSCPRLEYLDLTDSSINDVGLMSVVKCKWLRTLKLGFCDSIHDEGLTCIASSCSNLEELDIYRSIQVSDIGVTAICKGCTKLTSLNMAYNTRVTDTALLALAGLRDLRVLEIRNCSQLTSHGLLTVARSCCRLAELDVKMCTAMEDFTPMALSQCCKNLQKINLSYCMATDEGVVSLARLSRMQNMSLVHVKNVSANGFAELFAAGESLKKVKLLVHLKEALEPALVEQVKSRGCKISWTEKL